MEVIEVDPNELSVSEFNERVETDMGGGVSESDALQASVDKVGVIQPPLVRQRNGEYEVVVGQRRTLAAQSAKDRGKLESIPVVVVQWDDADALLASISENVESFRENVAKRDRALAIERLKEMKDWDNPDVADEIGVSERTIVDWLEYIREEWKGTTVHSEVTTVDDHSGQQSVPVGSENEVNLSRGGIDIERMDTDMVKKVRNITGGGSEGEQMLKTIQEKGLSQDDVRDIRKLVQDRGVEVDEAIEKVSESKPERQGQIRTVTTFTGDYANAMQRAAKDRATTENEIARIAITEWLENNGYL